MDVVGRRGDDCDGGIGWHEPRIECRLQLGGGERRFMEIAGIDGIAAPREGNVDEDDRMDGAVHVGSVVAPGGQEKLFSEAGPRATNHRSTSVRHRLPGCHSLPIEGSHDDPT